MNIQQLVNHLRGGQHKLKFIKANGQEREMLCTLSEAIIENNIGKPKEKTKEATDASELSYIRIFDLESRSWKSCIKNNIVSLDGIIITK